LAHQLCAAVGPQAPTDIVGQSTIGDWTTERKKFRVLRARKKLDPPAALRAHPDPANWQMKVREIGFLSYFGHPAFTTVIHSAGITDDQKEKSSWVGAIVPIVENEQRVFWLDHTASWQSLYHLAFYDGKNIYRPGIQ
jgi:hypothetical protein